MSSGNGFNLRQFIAKPNAESLHNITKLDWIALAKFYGVEIAADWKKQKIVNAVCDYFMNEKLLLDKDIIVLMSFGDDGKDSSSSGSDSDSSADKGAKAPRIKSDVGSKSLKVTEMTEAQMQFQIQTRRALSRVHTSARISLFTFFFL